MKSYFYFRTGISLAVLKSLFTPVLLLRDSSVVSFELKPLEPFHKSHLGGGGGNKGLSTTSFKTGIRKVSAPHA